MNTKTDSGSILRLLTGALGLGTILFSVPPIVAPRAFAVLFGLPHDAAAAKVGMRSVGVRDLVNGIGLLATMNDPARSSRWLLVRFLSDCGDALACRAALIEAPKDWRLRLLGGVAAGASLVGAGLLAWSQIQRAASR
ncbi:MAG: DUF4267 domain-containing protein [Chloroflexota bacterium]